jgi:hypothetical protein
VSQSSQSS